MYEEPKLDGITKSEKKRVESFVKQISIMDKKMHKLLDKKNIIIFNIDELDDDRGRIGDKIYNIEKRVKDRCKHDYDRQYWRNMRDDASFEKYCGCSNCGEIIWDECK